MADVWSSIRYLLADFIGDDDAAPPFLPDGLPDTVVPIAAKASAAVDYQGPGYAQLYVDRLKRFVGRRGIDDVLFGEIARLMALRMSYDDPIRIAQTKLAELDAGVDKATARSTKDDIRKFRLDELVGALPEAVADPVLGMLEWMGWLHRPVSIRFSTASRLGIRRLKIEAGLRRWRLFSVRYGAERAWVERWLHMIDRA